MPNSLCSLCLQEKICPWQSVVMVFNFSEKHWLVFHGCPSPYMLILCIQLFWKYISLVNVLYMEVFKKLYKFSKTVDISFQIFPSHCLVFACFTQQVFFTLDVLIHSWGILGYELYYFIAITHLIIIVLQEPFIRRYSQGSTSSWITISS